MRLGSIICIYAAGSIPGLKIYVGSNRIEQSDQTSYFVTKCGINVYEDESRFGMLSSKILETDSIWKPLD